MFVCLRTLVLANSLCLRNMRSRDECFEVCSEPPCNVRVCSSVCGLCVCVCSSDQGRPVFECLSVRMCSSVRWSVERYVCTCCADRVLCSREVFERCARVLVNACSGRACSSCVQGRVCLSAS